MTDCTTLIFQSCETVEDAMQIRQDYCRLGAELSYLIVDMRLLSRDQPERLLIGVLMNLRRFFDVHLPIRLRHYPPYLPGILRICKMDQYFELLEGDAC